MTDEPSGSGRHEKVPAGLQDSGCVSIKNTTKTPKRMKDLNFDKKRTQRRAQTASMRRIVGGFMRTAMEDYQHAGYPFGKNLNGLLIWFEYGDRTTDN